MTQIFSDFVCLSGQRGLLLFKGQNFSKIGWDLKYLNQFFEFFRKKNKIFHLSNFFLNPMIKIKLKWEFLRKKILGITYNNLSDFSHLTLQLLNEVGKYGFLGIFQHQLARNFNLKPRHIHHHLLALVRSGLMTKSICIIKKISKISNPILLMVGHFQDIGMARENRNVNFQFLSKQKEFQYFKKLIRIIIRQEKNLGQKNLKYGILHQNQIFKKHDKRKIHRIWQKLREKFIKSKILFGETENQRKLLDRSKSLKRSFFELKKKGEFTTFSFFKISPPDFLECKTLLTISPSVQIQKIITINLSMRTSFPFLVDKLNGQVNPKTIHSIMRNFIVSRGLIKRFEQIGRQRMLKFVCDLSDKFKIPKLKKIIHKKKEQTETDQETSRRLTLLSWIDSHVLVLKDLGKKMALSEKKGLKRVDSKVVRRMLSGLIKFGHLKVVKIKVQTNTNKTEEIEFIIKNQPGDNYINKITDYLISAKFGGKKKTKKVPPKIFRAGKFWEELETIPSFCTINSFSRKKNFFSFNFSKTNCFYLKARKIKKSEPKKFSKKPTLFGDLKENFFLENRTVSISALERKFFWIPNVKNENPFVNQNEIQKVPKKKIFFDLSNIQKNEISKFFSKTQKHWSFCFFSKIFGSIKPSKRKFIIPKPVYTPIFFLRIFRPANESFPLGNIDLFSRNLKKVTEKSLKICSEKKFSAKKALGKLPNLEDFFKKKWDCELDVNLFQNHLFGDKLAKRKFPNLFDSNSKPFSRRLKGLMILENTRVVKLFFKKCFLYPSSLFSFSRDFGFFHLIKRSLEFPNNYFFFDLEDIRKNKRGVKPPKKEFLSESGGIKINRFFPLYPNTSNALIFFFKFFTLNVVYQKVFLFSVWSFSVELFFSFLLRISWLGFFQSTFKSRYFRSFSFFFKDIFKLFKSLFPHEIRGSSNCKTDFSRFFSELKYFFFFKSLEKKDMNFSPFILRQYLGKKRTLYSPLNKNCRKIGNLVEIRVRKKKKLYSETGFDFFKNLQGINYKTENFKQKKIQLFLKVWGRKSLKMRSVIPKIFFLLEISFLHHFLSKKEKFSFFQKVYLMISPPLFFSSGKNFKLKKVSPIKNFTENSGFINFFFKKDLRDYQKSKIFLFEKIIRFPGNERGFFDIFWKIPVFNSSGREKLYQLLFYENRIYSQSLILKTWKFSFFFLRLNSTFEFQTKSRSLNFLEFIFPNF